MHFVPCIALPILYSIADMLNILYDEVIVEVINSPLFDALQEPTP